VSIGLPELTPAQESLFLTLGGRALDSTLSRPFLGDNRASDILSKTGYDMDRLPAMTTKVLDARSKVFDIAVRAKKFDDIVRRFVADHPDAVVVELGAGLDTRMLRVDPPSSVDWYDVDFPAIVDLRRQLLPQPPNSHPIGADLEESDWLDALPNDRPAVLVADGLVAFLRQDGFVRLLNGSVGHFPYGELAFNAYTKYTVWLLRHLPTVSAIAQGVVNPGFNNPRDPEGWASGLTLVEEDLLTRRPEVADLPLARRLTFRVAALSVTASRISSTAVLRYQFGQPAPRAGR
jgi:O-methyltransferase involved in polyketide biosynthesis